MGSLKSSEEEVIMETAELINRHKKDLQVSKIYLESQIVNKQKILDEIKKELDLLKNQRDTLAETVKKEKVESLRAIEQKSIDADKKLMAARVELENVTREKNMTEQEKSNVIGKRFELDRLIVDYSDKLEKIKRFIETIK